VFKSDLNMSLQEMLLSGNLALIIGSADLPVRFGKDPYSRLSWGQSSIRLNFNPVSVGLSNENLWWGPGKQNSILMSNTASGFKHLTLNTIRPVNTPIGSIEGQIIAGRLKDRAMQRPYRRIGDIYLEWC
jgi:hypothetical protein